MSSISFLLQKYSSACRNYAESNKKLFSSLQENIAQPIDNNKKRGAGDPANLQLTKRQIGVAKFK